MADKKFDLGDYVQVKDRIAKFYELFGAGRLVTLEVLPSTEPDGKPRIWVKAAAYRTADDPLPGIGWSWLELPGATTYTRGSELENAETSAWGRAIGSLGILIDGSIASQQEVDNKAGPVPGTPRILSDKRLQASYQADVRAGEAELAEVELERPLEPFESTVQGKVAAGRAPVDIQFRQTPTGLLFGFVLEAEGGKRLKVLAVDGLAQALQVAGADKLKGVWVTAHGLIERVGWKKDGRDMPAYQQMTLARLETPDWTLPAPHDATESDEPPALTSEDQAELDRASDALWPPEVPA